MVQTNSPPPTLDRTVPNPVTFGGVSEDRFRALAGSLPTGVCVVTTREPGGHPIGATAGAVCGLSRVPPLLLLCLDTGSRTLQALLRRGCFGVNILAADAAELSRRFAGPPAHRFDAVAWTTGAHDVPILTEGVVAHAICTVFRTVRAGDHLIVMGLIVAGDHRADTEPLLYHRRRYAGFPGETAPPSCKYPNSKD